MKAAVQENTAYKLAHDQTLLAAIALRIRFHRNRAHLLHPVSVILGTQGPMAGSVLDVFQENTNPSRVQNLACPARKEHTVQLRLQPTLPAVCSVQRIQSRLKEVLIKLRVFANKDSREVCLQKVGVPLAGQAITRMSSAIISAKVVQQANSLQQLVLPPVSNANRVQNRLFL